MGQRRIRRNRQGGTSIVEMMFALSIIAISLFAILAMTIQSTNMKENQRQLDLAKQEAQLKLEEFRVQPITSGTIKASLVDGYIVPTYGGVASGSVTTSTFAVEGLNWTPEWTPTNGGAQTKNGRGTIVADATNPNLLDVSVTIDWKRTGGTSTFTMRSLYTK